MEYNGNIYFFINVLLKEFFIFFCRKRPFLLSRSHAVVVTKQGMREGSGRPPGVNVWSTVVVN